MATSNTATKAKSNDYKFTVNSVNLSLTDGANVKIVSDNDYKLTLKSLRYHKKIYQPGFIEAKLLLRQNTKTTSVPTKEQVVAFFKNKPVNLSQNGSTTKYIAKGYYVYKVMPEYLRETKGEKSTEPYINVTLHIYSPDHKLTLDKYCKTHVNKKLVADILTEETEDGGILKAAGFSSNTVDGSNIRFLNYYYVSKYIDNDENQPEFSLREFIQPYLVQYNESFYDFLSRTANRCGEYLYYEDGILYLGLKKSTSTEIVDTNKALSVSYQDADESIVETTSFYLNSSGKDAGSYVNYDAAKMLKAADESNQDKKNELINEANKGTINYPFYDEIPFDDYFGLNFKKDNFSTFGKEFFKGLDELVSFLNSLLNMSTPTKMLAKLTVKYGNALVMAGGKLKDANRNGNEKWVIESDGSGKNRHASEQYDSTAQEATLYGSKLNQSEQNKNYDIQQNLNAKFYRFIADGCQNVSNQLVRVNVGTEATPYLLGEEVTLKAVTESNNTVSSNDKKYIVTEVSEVLMCDDAQRNSEDWQMGQRITVVPYYTKSVKQGKNSVSLTMPCPPVVLPFVKTSGPQRAYVAESGDPGKLGRVCIRYPWQNKDDVSSPWIRMAVPFAPNDSTNGGGMLFTPDEGDEVLVDYENGNIEHPYVIGSLYTGRAKAPGKGRSIVSKRGHRLTFNDDDSIMDFMSGIYPGLEIAKNFSTMISFGDECDFGEDNDFCGGTTITDKWGIYKIDASSTNRKITIQSPFGDVSISALSGIQISAPNGDVTIKGKNVSIEAGNEVNIVSGKFINEKKLDLKSFGESYLKDLVSNVVSDYVAPIADFSLLRTVFEALVKPAAGTLNIQSGRYLLLNAGGGQAEIPNKGYSVKGLIKQESAAEDKVKMANTIRTIDTFVDTKVGVLWDKYKDVQEAMAEYVNYDDMHKKLKLADVLKNAYDGVYLYNDKDFDYISVFKNNGIIKNETLDALKALKIAIRTLKSTADKIKTGNGISNQDEKTYGVELKPTVESCLPAIIKDICDGKDKEFKKTEADFNALKTPFKRMLFDKTNEKAKVLQQDPPTGQTKVTFNSLSDYDNLANWDKFISYLGDYNTVNKKLSLAATLADSVKKQMEENVPFTTNGWSYENDLWDTCKQGEILLSDKGQKETINIVNGALNRTPNTDDYMDELKDQLRNM